MFWKPKKSDRVYLDYAAATPVHSEVFAAMKPYFSEQFANAGAIHAEGVAAKAAVDGARLKVSRTLGIREPEILFTASGSESNNLAIYGYVRQLVEVQGLEFSEIEIISTAIEHPSVLEVLSHLSSKGAQVTTVKVDAEGRVDTNQLAGILNEKTRLITFAYANSEIGTVQDVRRITRLVKKYNTENKTSIKVHLDAAQAPLWLSCQMPSLGVDLMSLDAGKCEGPKGVGILAVRNTELKGVVLGGGQEMGLRAGTENTAGIVGAAKALEMAQAAREESAAKVRSESALLWQNLKEILPTAVLNGPPLEDESRLPNNVNISIPGLDTEFTVVVLDKHGIAASTKSACSGAGSGESGVVKTISNDAARASSTIRFSLGPNTDLSHADATRIANILLTHQQQMQCYTY